jgi:CubicO group peptidase (beta-lactamase class C family)
MRNGAPAGLTTGPTRGHEPMSAARKLPDAGIARLHAAMSAHVERGELPGLVALVAVGEAVHVEVVGKKDFGDREPLPRDAVFRIASLTKPIAAAAAMTFVDDGTFALEDSVEELLPELAHRRVLRSIDAELDDTVPAERPITIEDLLTCKLGFGIVLAPPGTYPIQRAAERLDLGTLGPPWPPHRMSGDEWIRRLASLPWMDQPGAGWRYNTGIQVLGLLLQRAGGRPLGEVLRARILEPLGMDETAFTVRPDQVDRLTTAYEPDPVTGQLHPLDRVADSYWRTELPFPTAAGWLVSTIDDLWLFVRMLLGRGSALDGTRVLSAHAVEEMLVDRLTPEQRQANRLFLGDDSSWGYGMAVPIAGRAAGPQPFGWDGGTGTVWRSDARAGVTRILLTQRAMTSPEPPASFVEFASVVDEIAPGIT